METRRSITMRDKLFEKGLKLRKQVQA